MPYLIGWRGNVVLTSFKGARRKNVVRYGSMVSDENKGVAFWILDLNDGNNE
jgi:hypothetical protein